jgi:hypothetical protein
VREASGQPRPALGPLVDLALLSLLSLYLEMVVIRWLAADVRVFAYLKNLPLLAAFLGLGLGCVHGGRRLFGLAPALCLVLAGVIAFAQPLGLTHLYFPQHDVWTWNDANFAAHELPPALLTARFFAVVLGLFFLVVGLFAALGARLGTLFDTLPPTRAYTINLLASLAGIWLFAAVSWLGWPPAGWFALAVLGLARFLWRRRLALALLIATLLVVGLAPGATRWSPYYRIDLAPLLADTAEGPVAVGQRLTVNHDYHQQALNLGDRFLQQYPSAALEQARRAYDLPYRFGPAARVLVVGAGLGNDVAAALRAGAERVDAVEIDPAILELGRALHPEQPYSSPRVRLLNDDARSVFARAEGPYDLIVFGLLDSHTLLSSLSSVRLDSYVYTLESLRATRGLLAPAGRLALSFAATPESGEWLAARLFQLLTEVFGEEPVALRTGYDASTLFVAGAGVRERLAADSELAALALDPAPLRQPLPLPTDDWPFLYLRERAVPWLPYGALLVLLLTGGVGAVLLALGGRGVRFDAPLFLLGAGFMLVQVKSVGQLSLLFGATWLVNALIVSAILLLALAANLWVARRSTARVGPAYLLLGLALLLDYVVPLGALNGQATAVKATLGTLLPVLPLLFAGVVFAALFARTRRPAQALGANLLGALAGGLLEYAAMAVGFKALGLLALGLYGASWLALSYREARYRERAVGFARRQLGSAMTLYRPASFRGSRAQPLAPAGPGRRPRQAAVLVRAYVLR